VPDQKPPGYAAYTNEIAKWETGKLLQAAKDVAELVESRGYEWLLELLSQREQKILDALVHGPVLSESKYASQTSMVSGIRQLRDAAGSLIYAARERERELQARAEKEQVHG
jgi:hypothetical protein